MKLLILSFFVSFISAYSQQDTIQLDEVKVYGKQNSSILKKIQKKFKKKFTFSRDFYQISLHSDCNNQNIFSIEEKNIQLDDKFTKKRLFPENIEQKLNIDYFKKKNIDEFHSPIFLLTKAHLRYIQLDKYITQVEIEKIQSAENDLLILSGVYDQCRIELCVDATSLDTKWIKIYTIEPLLKKATSMTKGSSKYTNAISNYYLETNVTITYLSDNQRLYLQDFKNHINVIDYDIRLFDKNKKNEMIQTYLFQIQSSLQLNLQT